MLFNFQGASCCPPRRWQLVYIITFATACQVIFCGIFEKVPFFYAKSILPILFNVCYTVDTFAWQEHIRFLQTEMLPDIVPRVDRRQPACRSALPQAAFLPRKNSAGLFGEGKSDDDKEENRRNTCVFQGSMTQSALICTVEKRVCPCQTKVM